MAKSSTLVRQQRQNTGRRRYSTHCNVYVLLETKNLKNLKKTPKIWTFDVFKVFKSASYSSGWATIWNSLA